MRLLSTEELAERWSEIKPKVQLSLDHGIGESSVHDLFLECMASNAQAWEYGEAIGITRFIQFKGYRQLQLVTCTGSGWFEYGSKALIELEAFAKEMQCRNISMYGRKGWERAMKPLGYEYAYTVLVKEI